MACLEKSFLCDFALNTVVKQVNVQLKLTFASLFLQYFKG